MITNPFTLLRGFLCWILLPILSWGLSTTPVQGQTPSDAVLMKQNNICILFNNEFGSFDEYWEGEYLRKNETIATIHRHTALTMAAIGIFDKLDIYVGVPYVTTKSSEPNGGKFAGVSNFQDILFAAKYEALNIESPKETFSLLGSVGYSTPINNYLSDYKPYSIGLGAPEFSTRGIIQYRTSWGGFARVTVGYLWRGYTKAERDYYYNDGSYYTAWMDVPNTWNIEGNLGIWCIGNSLKFELSYFGLKSTNGDDIRPYNAAQPTNKIKVDRVGFSAQYYLPNTGFGALIYHNRILEGRNVGKVNSTGIGLTYQFSTKKQDHEN